VNIPPPKVGLVICYAYLWRDEARSGLEEGRKDRPCVIVVATEDIDGELLVTVAPITHTPPAAGQLANAIELPAPTKARLGLDDRRSWAIASDLNRFVWPGVDLRPTVRGGDRVAYGYLPTTMTEALRAKILQLALSGARLTTERA
jgi:hypothetical protein